jgi:hypothetical protein
MHTNFAIGRTGSFPLEKFCSCLHKPAPSSYAHGVFALIFIMRGSCLLQLVRALVAFSLSQCASALVHAGAGLQMVLTASVAHTTSTNKPTAISRLNKLVWAESIDMQELDRTMSLQATTLASKERRHMAAETLPEEYLALLQWLSTAQDQTRQVELHANPCKISHAICSLHVDVFYSMTLRYAELCCLS